ncbi:hypothetical protein MASR2M17_17160 [Aminivibrio sp.]
MLHGHGGRGGGGLLRSDLMFVYRKLSWKRFSRSAKTAHTSAAVLFLIAAASLFRMDPRSGKHPQAVANAMLAISDNYWVVLLLFNLLLLVLGMFMETIAIVLIVVYLLSIMQQMGVDPIPRRHDPSTSARTLRPWKSISSLPARVANIPTNPLSSTAHRASDP